MFISSWILLIIAVIFIYLIVKISKFKRRTRRLRREIDKLEGYINGRREHNDDELGDAEGRS